MTRRPSPGSALAAIAALIHRFAVLLAAGIPAPRAWDAVAASAGEREGALLRSVADADDVPSALVRASVEAPPTERRAWRCFAAGMRIASVTGAPPGAALLALAEGLRGAAEAEREVAAALAGPRASARVVLALPVLGLAMASLLDLGALPVLVGTPLGGACLTVGAALVILAARWSSRIVRRARPRDPFPGVDLELAAVALSGGIAPDRALALLDSALAECGLPVATPLVAQTVSFAVGAGAPATGLLRAEAADRRSAIRSRARAAADEAAVALLLPLGVCVLPAFVVLGVIPVLAGVLGTAIAGWG